MILQAELFLLNPDFDESNAQELIGAMLLCQNPGISPEIRPDHVQYIRMCKKNLNEEPENLIKAAEQATDAVKFL